MRLPTQVLPVHRNMRSAKIKKNGIYSSKFSEALDEYEALDEQADF